MPYGPKDYHICKVFECIYDGEIKSNEEISEIKFFGMNELKRLLIEKNEIFTPWFVELLKWYFKMENKLTLLP
jgi:isopentenyldiphosphate isomerase